MQCRFYILGSRDKDRASTAMQFVASIFLLGSLALFPGSQGYSTGPPKSACLTMFPLHNVESQSGAAPFNLTLSSATYTPGQTLTLRVQSIEGSNRRFKGFQVSAHRVVRSGNQEEFVGTFSTRDNSSQIYDCLKAPKSMVTHKDASLKTVISMNWTAPAQNMGDLQLLLTVLENKTTFWTKIPFSLQASSGEAVVPPETIVPGLVVSSDNPPDWSTCYESKGCWLVADARQGGSSCDMERGECLAALSYRRISDDKFAFELSYKGRGEYVGLGFSDDKFMGDDLAIVCAGLTNHESVQMGFNYGVPAPYKYFIRQFTRGLSDLVMGETSNHTFCKFTLAASVSVLNGTLSRPYDLRQQHYLFLSWGRIFQGTDNIYGHSSKPAISEKRVDLKDYKTSTSAAVSQTVCYTVLIAAVIWAMMLC